MFALLEIIWNLLQNPYNISYLTLGTLLHYFGNLRIHISANIQQIWNKMQINCISSAAVLIPLRE